MGFLKTLVLRIVTFLLVFMGTVFVVNYWINNNPFHVSVDAVASIKVWNDENGDGKIEEGEPFMPNVCVWGGYASDFTDWRKICESEYFVSDSNGGWSEFFPGGECDELYSAVNPPIGYRPTTPVVVNGCSVKFGLVLNDSANTAAMPVNVGQYLQEMKAREEGNENVVFWLTLVVGFVLISVFASFISFKLIRPLK